MWISVDIEADGPIPGDYSMICLGAVIIEQPSLINCFYGQLQPISNKFIPENLAISGFTRDETLVFDDPYAVMFKFNSWLENIKKQDTNRLFFLSDNNGFDWQFVNYYFHHFLGKNPFGYSSTNLGSLYKGLVKDMFASFKHLRNTKHTHNPVDDAKGNAEAFLKMKEQFELNIKL